MHEKNVQYMTSLAILNKYGHINILEESPVHDISGYSKQV